MATVVKERVNGLLEHALLVPDNDFRSLEKEQVLKTVVAVDDATVEVVQVGGGETAAFEGHKRTQIRWDDREHELNHPLRARLGCREALGDLETLGELLLVLLGLGGSEFLLELHGECREVDLLEQLHDRFCAHHGFEGSVAVCVFRFTDFHFGEELADLEGGVTLVGDNVILVIDYALKLAGAHVEHQADAGRHALVEPDMGNWHSKLDVSHALAANATQGHLDAAAVADNALVLDALVFSTGAFPVPCGSEDALAEKAALFRFEGTVVDRLGVFHLTLGPRPDDFRRGHGDGYLVKGFRTVVHAKDFAKVVIDTHDRW